MQAAGVIGYEPEKTGFDEYVQNGAKFLVLQR